MTSHHHEVPTHLDVEDKVLFGLTVRQFLYVLVGSSATYALWEQLAPVGDGVRVTVCALSVVLTLAFGLLRPAGRALEEWVIAALLYGASARCTTWQPREPEASDWRPVGVTWQELAPSATWTGGDAT